MLKNWKKWISLVLAAALSGGTPAYVYGEGKSPGTPTSLSDTAGDTDTGQGSSGLADIPSRRILFATDDPSIIRDTDTITSSYGDVYLVQYGSTKEAGEAYQYYSGKADFVDYDTAIAAAEGTGETPSSTGTVMTAKENPLAELSAQVKDDKKQGDTVGAGKDGHPLVALVDSGAPKNDSHIVDAVSMIGDDPYDDNGHGTDMAGAVTDIDPDARILSIKVLDKDGRGDISAVYAGIQYAIEKKAAIINLSMSAAATATNAALRDAVKKASDAGIIVIGAAGNQGQDVKYFTPGNIDEAYIIGAGNGSGTRNGNSNYGDTVDYLVSAESTSEAAAHFTGMLSAMKLEDGWKEKVLDKYAGAVFLPDSQDKGGTSGGSQASDGEDDDFYGSAVTDFIYEGSADRSKCRIHLNVNSGYTNYNLISFYNNAGNYVQYRLRRQSWTIGKRSGNFIADITSGNRVGQRGSVHNWWQATEMSLEQSHGNVDRVRLNDSGNAANGNHTITLHLNGGVATGGNGDFWPGGSGADIVIGSSWNKIQTGSSVYDSIHGLVFTKPGYTYGGMALDGQLVYDADGNASEERGIWKTNWFNGNGTKKVFASIASNVNAWAVWYANTKTVYFNGNGGTVAYNGTQQFTAGNSNSFADTGVSRQGYTFLGWAESASATKADYSANNGVSDAWIGGGGSKTLYAVWRVNNYTVTYNKNGSTDSNIMPDSTATYDTNFVTRKNVFSKTGYDFDGWNEKADGSGTPWTLMSAGVYENGDGANPWKWTYPYNITLYAQWRYHVQFDGNAPKDVEGNTLEVAGSVASMDSLYSGHSYALNQNQFSVYGYEFLGWSTDKNDTSPQYTDGGAISGNPTPNNGSTVTLYAIWKISSYPVTYRLQKDSDAEIDMPATVSLANKKTVVYPAHGGLYFENPRMTNARFTGWTCAELGVTDKTKDLTVSSDQVKAWYEAKTDKADNVGLTMVAHFETVPPFEFVDEKTGETPILNETEKNQGKFRIEEIESSPGYIYEDQYHDIDIRDKDDTHEYQDNDYRNLTFPEKNGK